MKFPSIAITLSLTGILLLTASCNRPLKPTETVMCNATGDRFFPLCDFVRAEVQTYTAKGYTADKEVMLNGRKEYLTGQEINWRTELQPLAAAYINRSAWLERFTVDTLETEEGFAVHYRARVPDIPVKSMSVTFGPDTTVSLIEVTTQRKNLLYSSSQDIAFEPAKGYRVEGWQKALFMKRTTFYVNSEIRKQSKEQ